MSFVHMKGREKSSRGSTGLLSAWKKRAGEMKLRSSMRPFFQRTTSTMRGGFQEEGAIILLGNSGVSRGGKAAEK